MKRSKRALDLVIGLPLAIAVVPLVGAVWAAQRLTGDRGPVLYRGRRMGEGGRHFEVMKLRTMTDGLSGGPLTGRSDPRVTSLGRFLRRSKLDELPQLWNVVRGEMSLVGPRPEDPAFVDWSDAAHREVFTARPGITGLAQLVFFDEEAMHRDADPSARYRSEILPSKLDLDRRYLARASVRLDVRIIASTLRVMVGRILGKRTRGTLPYDG